MKDMLANVKENALLISGTILILLGIINFTQNKTLAALIAAVIVGIIIIALQFIAEPKWTQTGHDNLKSVEEPLKSFGASLPLGFLSKITVVLVGIMLVCSFSAIVVKIVPTLGILTTISTVLNAIATAFLYLSLFYTFISGNFKSFAKGCMFSSIYFFIDVILTFILESMKVSLSKMLLFAVFWVLFTVIDLNLQETEPIKKEKPKKEKIEKVKKDKSKKTEDPAPETTDAAPENAE